MVSINFYNSILKLEQLIKSETYRNSIVNEADKLVCSDFNIITICNKIEKIYENM